jgi:6,7-dimethyl-8-ribityllumazine synthase
MADSPHLLIIEARFYEDMADELLRGAEGALTAAGATFDVVSVPGVLEVPAALVFALQAEENDEGEAYDGFVALGCVIRGETTHYDIVSNESARALMDLSTEFGLALGNGIQTVENDDQAWARVKVSEKNKGGAAAKAALTMIELKRQFGVV